VSNTLGEPAVDRPEQRDRLLLPALLLAEAEAGDAHSTAQFPSACDVDALLHGKFGLADRPGAGER
jgi:hypothetical protein